MEYMLLIYADEAEMANATPEDVEGHATAFGAYVRELMDRGVLRGGAPLQPTSVATTLRVREGRTLTMDGPFVETKEALVGFYHLDCKDLDEALELAAKIPAARFGGAIEIRPSEIIGRRARAGLPRRVGPRPRQPGRVSRRLRSRRALRATGESAATRRAPW